MNQPTTSIGFSPTTPAAPNGYINTVPQTDGGVPLQKVSEYVPNVGGVSTKTANYTAIAKDNGTLLSFNSSSALTLTLPAAPPFAVWKIAVQNIGTGVVTVSRNGLNIDGMAVNLNLAQNSGATIFTDGTNYFTERGSGVNGSAGGDLSGTYPNPTVVATHLSSPLPVAQGGTGTTTPGLVAGTNVTVSGTWPNQTVAASGGGGGGSTAFPFTIIQESPFQSGSSNVASYTITFPQALAASGATAFLLIGCDGSSAVTVPTGWTQDINKQQSSYARFILCHKTSAGDTSATITIASPASFAIYFFEISGSHSLDTHTDGGSANTTLLATPAITPAAGSLVFSMVGLVPTGTITANNNVTISPAWKSIVVSSSVSGGARGLMGWVGQYGATSVSTQPPPINLTGVSLFSGGGLAYSTFSIL